MPLVVVLSVDLAQPHSSPAFLRQLLLILDSTALLCTLSIGFHSPHLDFAAPFLQIPLTVDTLGLSFEVPVSWPSWDLSDICISFSPFSVMACPAHSTFRGSAAGRGHKIAALLRHTTLVKKGKKNFLNLYLLTERDNLTPKSLPGKIVHALASILHSFHGH